MVKHVATLRNEITSRVCADHEKSLWPEPSTLFVGAVTTEVQIHNEECYVMLPSSARTYHKTQDRHRLSS